MGTNSTRQPPAHIFLKSQTILNEWGGAEVKTEKSPDSHEVHVMGKYGEEKPKLAPEIW